MENDLSKLTSTIIPALASTRDSLSEALEGRAGYFRPSAYRRHYDRFQQLVGELKEMFPGAFDYIEAPQPSYVLGGRRNSSPVSRGWF